MGNNLISTFNTNFTKKSWIELLENNGWICTNSMNNPYFRRPGKNEGNSGILIVNSGIILFHNFSSNANLPEKSNNKVTYNAAELVIYFYFQNNLKEAFDYFREYLSKCRYRKLPINNNNLQKTKNIIDFSSIYEKSIFNEVGEEMFTVAVNEKVINKITETDILTKKQDFVDLTTGFRNSTLTDIEIAVAVGNGFSILPSCFKEDKNGAIYKRADQWAYSNLIVIDIDAGTTLADFYKHAIAKNTILTYTTCSNTDDNQRFRVILPLPHFESKIKRYQEFLKLYSTKSKADTQATSASTSFYGNSNADIYLNKKGITLNYRKGYLVKFSNPREEPIFKCLFKNGNSIIENFSNEDKICEYIYKKGSELSSINFIAYDNITNTDVYLTRGIIWTSLK